ncbi:MAG: hypothetical protein ACYS74_13090 [Planctomycetota bacterium]|jgi:Fe2+ or Zn2+ uptake regulation protein
MSEEERLAWLEKWRARKKRLLREKEKTSQRNSSAKNEKTEKLARMVLNCLQRHPNAGDTLEGITKWWLETEGIESSVDEVADALETLVEQGVVRIRESGAGKVFYASGKHNRPDAFHD